MSEPCSEDDGDLREWAPLSAFLKEIPIQTRKGLFLENVVLTCIDCIQDHFAVGTNIGVVYWYNRVSNEVQRLRPQRSGASITCVRAVSSVDYMVAAGDKNGTVTIFKLPKPIPEEIPDALKQNYSSNVETFTVGGMHSCEVTALEWSVNGQKLFSGDIFGIVVFTEIDFYMNLSKACEVLNEKYRIVQLSFNHNRQTLLVATEFRCIIVFKNDNWKVVQVGQKERNRLCRLGGTFKSQLLRPMDPVVYTCRSGFRIWQSDKDGVVQKTILFKHHRALRRSHCKSQHQSLDTIGQQQFDEIIFSSKKIASKHQGPNKSKRKNKKQDPRSPNAAATSDNSDTVSVSPSIQSAASEDDINEDIPSKQSSTNLNGNQLVRDVQYSKLVSIQLDESSMVKDDNDSAINLQNSIEKRDSADNASERSSNIMAAEPSTTSLARKPKSEILSNLEIPVDFKPDLRSPETILRDVQEKERLLAEALDLQDVLLSTEISDSEDCVETKIEEDIVKPDWREETEKQLAEQNALVADELQPESSSLLLQPESSSLQLQPSHSQTDHSSDQDQTSDNSFSDDDEIGESKSAMLCDVSSSKYDYNNSHPTAAAAAEWMEGGCIDGWVQHSCPETVQWLSVCSEYVVMGGPHLSLHCSPLGTATSGLAWHKLDYEAVKVVVSYNGQIVWKLDFSGAYALNDSTTSGPFGDSWKLIAHKVESVSLTNDEAWFVTDGRVFYQDQLSRSCPTSYSRIVPMPEMVLKVCASDKVVWVLTKIYEVFYRVNHEDQKFPLENNIWKKIEKPANVHIADIALGPKHIGWIIDNSNNIYCSDDFTSFMPTWWQVVISSFVFESPRNVRPEKFLGHKEKLLSIATCDSGIWITNKIDPFIHMNNTSVIGHQWCPVPLQDLSPLLKWRQICAEGVYEGAGQFWLLSKSGDLFFMKPNSMKIKSVLGPCRPSEVLCLSAARHVLWLLTDRGDIFIRQGIDDANPEGFKWRNLNLEQIEKRVHLRHICCGSDVVWASDTKGDIHMAVGSAHSIATNTFPPAWVQVEGKPNPNIIFTKVYVGPQTFMVWALDSKHNVYVREAIFPDFQLGLGWVPVRGIHAVHLCVSDVAVWAISPEGSVYRRYGITQNNYIGDYWMRIPGSLTALTVSLSEDMWGISQDSNELLTHLQKIVAFGDKSDTTEDNEVWEMV
ncbi:tectonin beta-propeller repeat-containing protein 2 [Nilaparvata lugens]|uniref:tectonin beta-propeller repeat-containing protein 2 n=1 Tax=Nilaparvata lugens TaxID=108931 RepID=UPI00193E9AB9|nr:tectonin beta-propeller repeat-containing protein 2 [Nilaparvata lugens]